MEATKSLKYPFLTTRDTSPSRAVLEGLKLSPSDGCPATATCLASTQALRSRRGPSLRRSWIASSHTGQTGAPHRLDRYRPVRPVRLIWHCCSIVFGSPVLALWINQGTQWFLVNHWKPCELGVASTNYHSWLGSHVVPARPWFWGSTKKPSTTSSCGSCHHAARTWPRWPQGPSNEPYLSFPHLEASPMTTFRACSSPAPTPVKPQPVPAILI
jgi:hypothetical protein